jgi:hypothetical protein
MDRSPFPGKLDRSFISFRTAVRKEHTIETRKPGKQARQAAHRFVVIRRTHIDDAHRLFRQRIAYDSRRMSKRIDGPALDKIEIGPAFRVI